jgi:dTDP-4-amino-4,6-dideoxygalactose transaminase
MISMAKPYIGEEEINAVVKVMRSGMIACGTVVTEFEAAFAQYADVEHAVATTNGTTALHTALLALGIEAGDKVITSPFTFIASSNSILFCGATPVFVDIDPDTYLMDPDKLAVYLEKHYDSSMKAIMPVHLFGLACDMPKIMAIADKYNLKVIEDCAQSHGAEIGGKKAGSFGDAACFSFYPTKNMTTGEGGICLFRDETVAKNANKYINHGRVDQYLHDVLGYNYRMTNISAAIGLEQIKRVDGFNQLRRANAQRYDELLAGQDKIALPKVNDGYKHVYHQYTIRLLEGDRDALQAYLKEQGIGSAVVYPFSMNEQPFYKNRCEHDSLAVSEAYAKQVLSIPVHPALTQTEVIKVANAILTFIAAL